MTQQEVTLDHIEVGQHFFRRRFDNEEMEEMIKIAFSPKSNLQLYLNGEPVPEEFTICINEVGTISVLPPFIKVYETNKWGFEGRRP